MLRNLRWLSTTPLQIFHGSGSQGVPNCSRIPIRIRLQSTAAFDVAELKSKPAPEPLKPTGTLPPLQNDKEYHRVSYKSPGLTINTYQRGNGEHAVLVIPGELGIMRTQMLPLVEGLDKDKYSIYTIDQPGYGESVPAIRDLTMDRDNNYKDSIYNDYKHLPPIMANLGHKKYSVLGWSAGAVTALLLALHHPDLVQKVLVWGAFMEMDEEQIESYRKHCDLDARDAKDVSQETDTLLMSILGEEFYREHLAHWGKMFAQVGEKSGGKYFAQILHAIFRPVTFVLGENDPVITPRQRDLYQKYVKHAEVVIIPNAKHAPQYENTSKFLSVVNEFLEKEVKE